MTVPKLYVCHGNICRSPMCEFVFKDLVKKQHLEDRFEIASAATSSEEIWRGVGNPVYPPAKRKLTEHGISCEGKTAYQMTYVDYQYYDYIVAMDRENLGYLYRISHDDRDHKISLLMDYTDRPGDVADPWYTRDFEATWIDVDEGCRAFLQYLLKKRS